VGRLSSVSSWTHTRPRRVTSNLGCARLIGGLVVRLEQVNEGIPRGVRVGTEAQRK